MTERHPLYVQCTQCQHAWVGIYFPMYMGDAIKLLTKLTCPACAAGTKDIQILLKHGERIDAS